MWVGKVTMDLRKIAAVLLMVCLAQPALAFNYDQREVLRGLKGLKVVTETIPTEIERLGLTRKDIQSDVETKLRKAGIKVLPAYKPPSMTTLYVNVHTLIPSQARTVVVYSINLMLFENAYLKREAGTVGDLKEVRAADWIKATVGLIGVGNVSQIRKKVEEQVNKFISDYLAMNQ
jgi:hypothetical protein